MSASLSKSRFKFERDLLLDGISIVAGVDEAGRGPLAGPVVAAAVILPGAWIQNRLPSKLGGLNDSKQLTPAQRERFFAVLTAHPEVWFAVSMVDVPTIDSINILQATHRAMNGALAQLPRIPQHVLVDGLRVDSLILPHTALIDGDGLSYYIAAASVIAKVTRDRLMLEYDSLYPHYGFAEHKGYGTERHFAALAQHGPCPIHRQSFAPMRFDQEPELF
jgi:ribonuclease HII